jgi:2,4-dienoyl-CoA reductase-like NADH-dependent reductase (Old Yellow Enzyme family)
LLKEEKMRLFDPISIGGVEVSNRIVMAPMTSRLADAKGFATEQGLHYYAARARGGTGLIIVEMTGVDPGGAHRARELSLHDDACIPGLRRLTEIVKVSGARIAIQIAHGGAQSLTRVTGLPSVAPSSIPYTVHEIVTETQIPKELTIQEISDLVERFAGAADRARRAGFDMVEVHGAHGYLIYQFLSPLTNKRTDTYGGSLEGRARFALDIIRAIKARVPDLPVIFRISADEYAEGGVTIEDSRRVCQWAEKAGADAIHISAGSYLSGYPYMVPPMTMPQGCFLHLAAAVKEVVRVPVMTAGRLHDPFLAEQAIAEGKTDMVAAGRQLIADPEWPNKVCQGRLDEVRKCLSCNYCLDTMRDGEQIECVCNVEVGREWLRSTTKNQGG